jgi:5-formyltetrahydrofolate cyclo-ligase
MTAPEDAKPALRSAAYAARKIAHADKTALKASTRFLMDEIGDAPDAVIAGYMPIRTEIDPLPTMSALAGAHRICVPVIEATAQPLKFREWYPASRMVTGHFGAKVPSKGDWLVPTILIVPLVAYDDRCNRLGYGGGFYDRTLAVLRAANLDLRAIGFAYSAQRLDDLPLEPTDQQLDAIVTEQGVIRP